VANSENNSEKLKIGALITAVSTFLGIASFFGWEDEIKDFINVDPAPSVSSSATPGYPYRALTSTRTTETETTTEEATTTTTTTDPEETRRNYIDRADEACRAAIANRPAVQPLTYEYMMNVLVARNTMVDVWRAVAVEPDEPASISRLRGMWSDFVNASWYWKYMAEALLRKDRAAFYAENTRYRAAMSSFADSATRYGFRSCNFQWNVVS
jgi:hypothetical protein